MENKAPIITCARHRIQSDGRGVTTLVLFHGCPLRCQWCINPYSYQMDTKRKDMTPVELYEKVKIDDLYFVATGGGITFGGGEPLMYPEFLQEFRKICPDSWHICMETSLNVPWENVAKVAQAVNVFYIDCKDTNPDIYRRYTGADNGRMIENVKNLLTLIPEDKIVIRLPLIPGYNTEADRIASRVLFTQMGITQFNTFTYQNPKEVLLQ